MGNAKLLLRDDFVDYFRSETGVQGPEGSYQNYCSKYITKEALLRDLLDTPTLSVRFLRSVSQYSEAEKFLNGIRRVLQEESIGYRIDDDGGIHPFVDDEFERTRAASIASMGLPRYGAALAHFEASYAALDGDKPDTRMRLALRPMGFRRRS